MHPYGVFIVLHLMFDMPNNSMPGNLNSATPSTDTTKNMHGNCFIFMFHLNFAIS